jgi:hypothetical protein
MSNPLKKSNPFLFKIACGYAICLRFFFFSASFTVLPVLPGDYVRPGVLATPRFFMRAE